MKPRHVGAPRVRTYVARIAIGAALLGLVAYEPAAIAQRTAGKAGANHSIRLTAIDDGLSGSACRLHLDPRGKVFVGGTDNYNDRGIWHLGISGRDYALHEAHAAHPLIVLQSADRKISVRIHELQKIWMSRDPAYPAEKYRVSVSITMNGISATQSAYELCGDG